MQKLLKIIFLAMLSQAHTSAAIISQNEFNKAITANKYKSPSDQIYKYFIEGIADFSREEAAMFLAQMIHESNGLRDKIEAGMYGVKRGI